MSNAGTLDYEHAAAPPNRYEWEMESERVRWLRRRFLWFSGTLVVVGAVFLLLGLPELFLGPGTLRLGNAIGLIWPVAHVAAAGWAWWYARRAVRNERRLFAIAFWLVAGLGVLGMVTGRISDELQFQYAVEAIEAGRTAAEQESARTIPISPNVSLQLEEGSGVQDVTPPPGRPGRVARTPTPAQLKSLRQGVSLGSIAWAILSSHLVACLFLPWTVREAARPAYVLLGAAVLLILLDIVVVGASAWYIAGAWVILPFTILPGLAWCWWRYSRFRKQFRFTFEGNQLRQLRQELTGARRIHESSLPPARAEGPVRLSYIYEPMSQIGGDLIFVHPRTGGVSATGTVFHDATPPQRQTVVLLDVTGHGIAAALTVNRLVGELERIFAERPEISCGELMDALNRYVYLTLATHGVFVTGVAICVDTGQGGQSRSDRSEEPHTVTFASAGHPSAFLRRPDGRTEALESNATMLGVLAPSAYDPEEQVFRLCPGEAIIAYTDGAIEARNVDDEMIGIDGVRAMIERIDREVPDPFNWPEYLIRRVAAWRSAPPADDTLIAVVYRPAAMVQGSAEPRPHAGREASSFPAGDVAIATA